MQASSPLPPPLIGACLRCEKGEQKGGEGSRSGSPASRSRMLPCCLPFSTINGCNTTSARGVGTLVARQVAIALARAVCCSLRCDGGKGSEWIVSVPGSSNLRGKKKINKSSRGGP